LVVTVAPFFTGNPAFVSDKAAAIKGVGHIVLTHGHGDHVLKHIASLMARGRIGKFAPSGLGTVAFVVGPC